MSDLRLSIVIPTFNESGNVKELLRRIEAVLGSDSWEVIFVDDDSPDRTAELVRAIARHDSRVRCLQRVGRRGLSAACIEGMMAAAAPLIAVMDADLQHDETILPAMRAKLDAGADLVIGTRYAPGGSTGQWDASRKTMSLLATRLSRLVLKQPVSDPMSGFFMLRREVIEQCVHRLSAMGFKILLDVLASATSPLRVEEVAYTFRERISGESKLDGLVVWEYGMLLLDKTVGRYIPSRFLAFSIVGGLGVLVHMALLTLALKPLALGFTVSQTVATFLSMVFNFALNNMLTYRDRRLKGMGWFVGLLSFVAACSVGAVANIGIATYLFRHRTEWLAAALAGVLIGAVWNYAVTQLYTWGKKP